MTEEERPDVISERISNLKIHGFPNAYMASSWLRRVIWLLLTWVAMAFCIYGIVTTMMNYYTYPVTVSVTFKDEALNSFPAVTICNLNKKRLSQGKSRYLLGSMNLGRGTEEQRIASGHQLSDMLRHCTYKEMSCYERHFILVNGSIGRYGNCYTFNSGFVEPVYVINPRITGRTSALEMVLDLEQREYSTRTQGLGFQIILHTKGQFPTPESKTVSIAPGFSTFIELSQARLIRALKPYGDCESISPEQNKLLNIWSRYGYNYSSSSCKYTQKQMGVITDCGCYYYEMPAPAYLENTTKPCSKVKPCFVKAAAGFYTTESWSHICPYVCEEDLYEATVSSHRWPSAASSSRVIKKYAQDINMTLQGIRETLAKVSIYYDSSKVKTIAESPMYASIFGLLGELGGHLGLWVGVSLLAVCEWFELSYDVAATVLSQ